MIDSLNVSLGDFEKSISTFLKTSEGLPLPLLILFSFGGGLAASLTPCCLSMLPLNLSYIGTANITSKMDALKKATLFILGAAIIFSLLGVFASFASFVLIEFRGYIYTAIGLFILAMALSELDLFHFPLPQFVKGIPNASPFIVGMAFALVSSPCASPILFAILAMSTSAGSVVGGSLVMVAYSFGYTGIIFVTSVFAGIAKQIEGFKKHSKMVSIISAAVLGLLGGYYLYSGIMWFVG